MSATRKYRGVVRGKRVEFVDVPPLAEGTEVDVIVTDATAAPSGHESLAALRAALNRPPRATVEDVELLLDEIKACRQPASYRGAFDEGPPA